VHRNVLSPALLEECRRHVDWLAEQNQAFGLSTLA
jgi:hypothetical protein